MQITRSEAIDLFSAMGVSGDHWNKNRMVAKVNGLLDLGASKEMELVTEDEGAVRILLCKVLDAITEGTTIDVVKDREEAPAEEEPDEVVQVTEETPDGQVVEQYDMELPVSRPEQEAPPVQSDKKKRTPKPKRERKPRGRKAPKEGVGVRESTGRPYLAGMLFKEFGLGDTIPDALIDKLEELAVKSKRKPGRKESIAAAKLAWHVLKGFAE